MTENHILLDKKDKKILYYLDFDSRQTLSQLAKKVGLSKQVIDYRIKSLVKRKIISQFYTVINISKMGYGQYKFYFKFQNVNLKKEKEIINFWIKSKNSIWVASCHGRWDLAVSVLAKNIDMLGNLVADFLNKYAKFISEKNILITQISSVFTKTYLTEKKEKKEFIFEGKVGHYQIDPTENKILSILATDARIYILDLIDKTHLSRDIINYRIKKLKKDGIILQYRILTNLNKIGYRLYKIILRLQNLSSQKEEEFKYFIKQHPNGVQFLKLLGNWDVELELEVKDEEQLYEILLEIRNKFSDTIRDYDVLLVSKEHKLNYFPF